MNQFIKNKKGGILRLCKKYKVSKLYAFGSITSDKFDLTSSDIDLIVELEELDPLERGEILLNLWDELEALFDRKVDLLSNPEIANPYLKKSIENSKVLIYDGSSEEVFV